MQCKRGGGQVKSAVGWNEAKLVFNKFSKQKIANATTAVRHGLQGQSLSFGEPICDHIAERVAGHQHPAPPRRVQRRESSTE